MDKEGTLYLDPDASEEDRKRAEEWSEEIEADELEKHREKVREVERELEKAG